MPTMTVGPLARQRDVTSGFLAALEQENVLRVRHLQVSRAESAGRPA